MRNTIIKLCIKYSLLVGLSAVAFIASAAEYSRYIYNYTDVAFPVEYKKDTSCKDSGDVSRFLPQIPAATESMPVGAVDLDYMLGASSVDGHQEYTLCGWISFPTLPAEPNGWGLKVGVKNNAITPYLEGKWFEKDIYNATTGQTERIRFVNNKDLGGNIVICYPNAYPCNITP